jgi:single-strand DNA-binding protein
MNNVSLVGRLTRDVEIKSSQNGNSFCNFTIAVNRNFKNANGEYDADFINCVAFKGTADFMNQYMHKGMQIEVTGNIRTRNYDNDQGQRIFITEINASDVRSLEPIRKNENTQFNQVSPAQFMGQESSIQDSDLPF